MYDVSWTSGAANQLNEKVPGTAARRYLLDVSETSLHLHRPFYGGLFENNGTDRMGGQYWRRGLTEQDEDEITASEQAERLGNRPVGPIPHGDPSREAGRRTAMEFILVYNGGGRRAAPEYTVLGVMTNTELAASYVAAQSARFPFWRSFSPRR